MPIPPAPILLQCPKCGHEEVYRPRMFPPVQTYWMRCPRCPECRTRMRKHPTKIICS